MILYPVSTASTDFYDNSRSSFTNTLPFYIPSNFQYVKLNSIHFENAFLTIKLPPDSLPHIFFIVSKANWRRARLSVRELNEEFEHYFISCVAPDGGYPFYQVLIRIKEGRFESKTEFLFLLWNIFLNSKVSHYVKIMLTNTGTHILALQKVEACFISEDLLRVLGFITLEEEKISAENIVKTYNLSILNIHTIEGKGYIYRIIDPPRPKTFIRASLPFNPNIFLPKMIKVLCENIEESSFGSRNQKVMAIAPPPQRNKGMYDYEFSKSFVNKLSGNYINSLTFKLTDENDKKLDFATGSATYLQLTLLCKSNKMHKEHLTILSGDETSIEHFLDNDNAKFSVILPKTLIKEKKIWWLNLTHLFLPSKIFNVTSAFNFVILTLIDSNQTIKVLLKEAYYEKSEDLIEEINDKMNPHHISAKLINNHTQFANSSPFKVELAICPVLAVILGFKKHISTADFVRIIDTEKNITANFIMQIHAGRPRYAKICCEQVKRTIFGDINEQVNIFVV